MLQSRFGVFMESTENVLVDLSRQTEIKACVNKLVLDVCLSDHTTELAHVVDETHKVRSACLRGFLFPFSSPFSSLSFVNRALFTILILSFSRHDRVLSAFFSAVFFLLPFLLPCITPCYFQRLSLIAPDASFSSSPFVVVSLQPSNLSTLLIHSVMLKPHPLLVPSSSLPSSMSTR
jgi:hypothetical protein